MQIICTSPHQDLTTQFFTGWIPFLLSNRQVKALKANVELYEGQINFIDTVSLVSTIDYYNIVQLTVGLYQ